MSDATADQEIKALIAQRLGDLKAGQLAKELTHLPPISLSVANAALAQIIISLNDALNSPNKIQDAEEQRTI